MVAFWAVYLAIVYPLFEVSWAAGPMETFRLLLELSIVSRFFLIAMASDPIETLRIAFEADFADFVRAVDEQLDETKKKTKETGEQADDAGKKFSALGAIKLGGLISAGSMLLDVIVKIALAVPNIAINLAQGAVAANAQFETFETQFTTLLGSVDAAKERLEDLSRFGVETPFELPEVVEGSRLLQTFGGDALAATENLRMVGDLAAGVNQPIQSLAFWIGRMYSALQGGQPFGEAAMRLQEMGVLTPELRTEMEKLQKSGAEGNEIWERFSEVAGGKFAGNMERLSKTFQGVMSNLADFQGFLLRVGGAPFFETIRDGAIEFLDILNDNEAVLTDIATGIGEIASIVVSEFRDMLSGTGIDPKDILDRVLSGVESVRDATRPLIAMFEQFWGVIVQIGKLLASTSLIPFIGEAKEAAAGLGTLEEHAIGAAQGFAIIKAALEFIGGLISPITQRIGELADAFGLLLSGDLEGAKAAASNAFREFENGIVDVEAAQSAWRESILASAAAIEHRLKPKIEETEEAAKEMVAAFSGEPAERPFEVEAELMDKFATQMIEAARNRDLQLEQAAQKHQQNITKILGDFEGKRAKLRIDSQKETDEAIADAQEELAQLAEDTDREIAQRRDEFNREELRETEDHLDEMRRIDERYHSDLKDAVANRDAVAIVRLRERHAQETREREEAFNKQQGRDREDQDRELAKIREDEAAKRAAINEELDAQINEILAKEAKKQLELEQRRDEQLAANEENLQAQQQQIEEAMARQLETIARNMADQKNVSEEGAREVLGAFNEVFGIGGDIDKMMEDFVKRRELRATITMNFENRRGQALAESSQVAQEAIAGAALGGRLGDIIGTSGAFGGIRPFAEGGSGVAMKPTLALMGEKEPEFFNFIPMSQLSSATQDSESTGRFQLDITGSAPPGIGTADVDRVAGIVLMALREAGVLATRGG